MSIGKSYKLGFLGHTDTVDYTEGWDTNPFKLTNTDNKIYGLGICDMKGEIAAFMQAVSEIDFNNLRYGIKAYFTYDEEIGFSGVKELIKSDEIFPETMIFGEPTNNDIITGSKGLLEYSLNFKGVKRHSSNPEKGINANLNAIKFLYELNKFYNIEIKQCEDKRFETPYTTMNIGIINGGTEINSTSSSCNVFIDFRIVNEKHLNIINKKIKELSYKYNCDVIILNSIEPFMNNSKVENIKTSDYITEASFVNCKNKIILGAGPITSHEVNEHITEESYNKLIKQYKDIIIRECCI